MKTAKELGISHKEVNAMIRVRDGLREGRFRHVKADKFYDTRDTGKPVFNMQCTIDNKDCGTVACIGGWMGMEMKLSKNDTNNYVMRNDGTGSPLSELFYPYQMEASWDAITPKRAAKAIDNFLNTGDPQWSKVVPAPRYR